MDGPDDERASAYRRRLLEGLAETIRQKGGYAGASVADVVRHARTSRRTFYEQFASLDECYVELMLDDNRRIIAATLEAVDPDADWRRQTEQAITAWSHAAVTNPVLVRSWIRDLGALGDTGRDLQRRLLDSFADLVSLLITRASVNDPGIREPSRHLQILLLGGMRELLATAFEDGDSADEVARSATRATIALLEMSREEPPGPSDHDTP